MGFTQSRKGIRKEESVDLLEDLVQEINPVIVAFIELIFSISDIISDE